MFVLFLLDLVILALLGFLFNEFEQIRQMIVFFILDKLIKKGGK